MIFRKSAILLWISKNIPKVPSIAPKNGARRVPGEPPEHFWGPRGVRPPCHLGALVPMGCQSEVSVSKKGPRASKSEPTGLKKQPRGSKSDPPGLKKRPPFFCRCCLRHSKRMGTNCEYAWPSCRRALRPTQPGPATQARRNARSD